MDFNLIKDVIQLLEDFDVVNSSDQYTKDVKGFKQWIHSEVKYEHSIVEPEWEGKDKGRSAESVINTLIVHMNRYAKTYSKAAIYDSDFSTQEEFIYLINLKAFGAMTKMELIKKNIQEKPAGMQIINRLINQGWVQQRDSETDKRSKVVKITDQGLRVLERQMQKIRQATKIVTGNLTHNEKMELIRLLNKLNKFHHDIFCKNIESQKLLDTVMDQHFSYGIPVLTSK